MLIPCKCGYQHKDSTFLIVKKDPIFNKTRLICSKCERRVFIRTISAKEIRSYVSNYI